MPDKLIDAIEGAHKYSDAALIQQQVYGEELRFTVLEGKVVSVLLRRTPRVVGDGKKTIKQLIAAENKSRRAMSPRYENIPQLDKKLVDQEYLESEEVLKKGKVLELGKGTMIKSGASLYEIKDKVHSSYFEVVEDIASKLGAGFFVTDLFVQDYEKHRNDDNYSFMECNTGPVLKSYYSCRDGKSFDILKHLITYLDRTISAETRKAR